MATQEKYEVRGCGFDDRCHCLIGSVDVLLTDLNTLPGLLCRTLKEIHEGYVPEHVHGI